MSRRKEISSGLPAVRKEAKVKGIPVINMARTGQNIVSLRKKRGLSVKGLQGVFGFATAQAIYRWQHGTAMPTVDNLVVLAEVFQVAIQDILAVGRYL